jgi:hypothetical protein
MHTKYVKLSKKILNPLDTKSSTPTVNGPCKSVAILLIKIMIDWHLGVDEKVSDLHEVVKFKRKTLVYQMMTNKIWCYFIYM